LVELAPRHRPPPVRLVEERQREQERAQHEEQRDAGVAGPHVEQRQRRLETDTVADGEEQRAIGVENEDEQDRQAAQRFQLGEIGASAADAGGHDVRGIRRHRPGTLAYPAARDQNGTRACAVAPVAALLRRTDCMLLLVDYSSLLYRAFHSIPSSVAVNGGYGFLSILPRLPTHPPPSTPAIPAPPDRA